MVNHTPDSLVKFCDATTAEKVLTTQALRWSAPHLFQDPFELSYDSQLNFSQEDLLKATVRHAVTLIFSAENPVGATPMLQAIRRWRAEERFDTPEEAQSVLAGLLEPMVVSRQEHIDRLMDSWRSYARRLRIISFTAKPDNLLAWQFYANNHQGVALRMRAGPETTLGLPKKVIYQDQRSEITRLKDQLDAIIKNSDKGAGKDFASKFLTKPKALAGQQEWRCMRLLSEKSQATPVAEASLYSDVRFPGNELAAIYFGANTPELTQTKLTKLAQAMNAKVKIFVAHLHPHNFNLEFERVNPPAARGTTTLPQAVMSS